MSGRNAQCGQMCRRLTAGWVCAVASLYLLLASGCSGGASDARAPSDAGDGDSGDTIALDAGKRLDAGPKRDAAVNRSDSGSAKPDLDDAGGVYPGDASAFPDVGCELALPNNPLIGWASQPGYAVMTTTG